MSIKKPDIVVKESLRTTDVPIANKVTAGDINEIKRSIDDTIDVVNETPSGTDYWKVYHVNQGVATDDSGDGTRANPFYTVRAALEKMNEEKLLLGVNPGVLSIYRTKIVVWGKLGVMPVMPVHRESLLVTAFEYVDFEVSSPEFIGPHENYGGDGLYVRWVPAPMVAGGAAELGAMADEFPHTLLPPLMITNMSRQTFIDNFLVPAWNSRDDGNYKTLLANDTYLSKYGYGLFEGDTSNLELGAWQGGDLVGTIAASNNTTSSSAYPTSFSFRCAFKNFYFFSRTYSSGAAIPETRHLFNKTGTVGAMVIAGRASIGVGATIWGSNCTFQGCSNVFAKNVVSAANWDVGNLVLDNCYAVSHSKVNGRVLNTVNIIGRLRTDLSAGAPNSALNAVYARHRVNAGQYEAFSISGETLDADSESFMLAGRMECVSYFAITNDIHLKYDASLVNQDVSASTFFIASTKVTSFNSVSCKVLRKTNTGHLMINNATVGALHAPPTQASFGAGAGIKANEGTLSITNLACSGNVVLEGTVVANLSGVITGDLILAAGATLNAVSLTVKGNVTFEAGATITWMGGTYTGTLTDPDNHFGGAVAGAYLNV